MSRQGIRLSRGDHFCEKCHMWIGNHVYNIIPSPGTKVTRDPRRDVVYGEFARGNHHSIIKKKYCDFCRGIVINEQTQERLRRLRIRKKYTVRAQNDLIENLRRENEILRKQIIAQEQGAVGAQIASLRQTVMSLSQKISKIEGGKR